MVNIHRLRRLFHTPHPIYLLVSDAVSIRYKTVFRQRYNVTVIEHEPPALPAGSAPYYKDVMLKLVAFKLYVWAPMVKRVIVLDGDVLVLRVWIPCSVGLRGGSSMLRGRMRIGLEVVVVR